MPNPVSPDTLKPTIGIKHLGVIKNGEFLYINSSTWKQSSAASKPSLDFAYDSGRFDRYNLFNPNVNFNEIFVETIPEKFILPMCIT